MCFFSAPKPPKMDKVVGQSSSAEAERERRRLLQARGRSATIANTGGALGLTGSGASYSPQAGSGGTPGNG